MEQPQDCLNVGFMTSGGLAPCLSSSIASLLSSYLSLSTPFTARLYISGYKGILTGDSILLKNKDIPGLVESFHKMGGSPIGSSRVKLTNVEDCINRGFVPAGKLPLEVAAEQLKKDGINVLHTIGGDDTNTQAAQLSFHLAKNGYELQVIGMPKTFVPFSPPGLPTLGTYDVHALYIPEVSIDIASEGARLRAVMDRYDAVNIFLSEGAGVNDIVKEKEKVLVQKSGYYARSSPASPYDRGLIQRCADVAVQGAAKGISGVAGQDDKNGEFRVIEFERIKGEKPFDVEQKWFKAMAAEIGGYGMT
ncbi:hypothetical protein TrRE_jg2992 [Triparma retinervis]|uniref:Phosphofructokinase domain-containing protein n=1 Tax=Triparma retinervis TaxID=2557542 RepID=A0A9W7DT49_9STRA|nr:hypothetical protein TrRE_jg2992 [Triparma retinervis]